MSPKGDPYAVLGVDTDVPPDRIAAAYRRLARRHHPDVSPEPGAERRMAEINAAWSLLRDPDRLAAWHRARGLPRPPSPAPSPGHDAPGAEPEPGTIGYPWPTAPEPDRQPAGWRRGANGEGAAGPPPGNPRGSVLTFGRHIGWSLGEIARVDPGYLVWLADRREGARYRVEIAALLSGSYPGTARR
jgi:curved DNA-binding protein CbpA